MISILSKFNAWCAELCGWLLSILMFLLLADLVMRGFGVPVLGLQAMALFVMVAVVYLGLGHCEEVDGHVRVEFGLELLPHLWKKRIDFVAHLIGCLTIAATTYAMFENFVDSYVEHEALAGLVPLPIYPIKFVMTFSLVLYFVQLCLNTFFLWRASRVKANPTDEGA